MSTPHPSETAAAVEQLLGPRETTHEIMGTADEVLLRLALDPELSQQLLLDLSILQRAYGQRGMRTVDVQFAFAALLIADATELFWRARGESDPDHPTAAHAAEYTATHQYAGQLLRQVDAEAPCLSTSILVSATMLFGAIGSLCQLVHRERAERREDGDGS